MALTLVISAINPNSAVAGQVEGFNLAVTNSSASQVTLSSLVTGAVDPGLTVGQPNYLTPNMPIGLGNPVIAGGATANYPFQVVFNTPAASGPSPNNPGGAAPGPVAATPRANFTLTAMAQASDGSVGSTSLMVPVLATIPPFPLPQGGALQFDQGANLITLAIMGAL